MRFKLVVMPDGKAILTSQGNISQDEARAVQEAWREWLEGDEAKVVIVPECEVVQVLEVDLDLGEAA